MAANAVKAIDLTYILSEKNKPITKDYIQTMLGSFRVSVKRNDITPFQEAMVHISYLIRDDKFFKNNKTRSYQMQSNDIEPIDDVTKAMPLQPKSYERLEFLGDAIIHTILAEYIFARYVNEDEGFMTKLRTKIEKGDTLYSLSKIIKLDEYVVISRYVEKNGGRDTNKNILEDAFEAFMGALSLEVGYHVCKQFMIGLIEKEIDLASLLYIETNFKEKLLQYFHLRKWADPAYGTLDVSGPENKKMYTMFIKCKKNVHDEGEIYGIGVGSSKKIGEQMAAKEALRHLGIYKDDSESECESASILSDSQSCSDDEYESDDESDGEKK